MRFSPAASSLNATLPMNPLLDGLWLIAATQIDEIAAALLSFDRESDCPVWSDQFAKRYFSFQSGALIQERKWRNPLPAAVQD